MAFKAPFRAAGFLDPTTDNLDNCDLTIEVAEYSKGDLHLAPGCIVTIAAFVMPETDFFIIDFMAPQREVALHIRPKLNEGHLALNSTAGGGKWQSEVRIKNLPLRKGRAFYMSVFITPLTFLIAFNGEHFAGFPHRLPYQSVNQLSVYKGLKVAAVYYDVDYKYSDCRFAVDSSPDNHSWGGCHVEKENARSAVYPRLPYRISLVDGTATRSFFTKGACLLMTLRPNFASKNLTVSFTRQDGKPAMELELFVNHSQGKLRMHPGKDSTEQPLWSLMGLSRRKYTDICICCTDTALRLFVGHRPVFQAPREKLLTLWDRVTELCVAGDADLVVLHFCLL